MKKSKIIILVTAILILTALIVSTVILRNTVMLRRSSNEYQFREAKNLTYFDRLSFTAHFSVRIIQGKDYRVEYGTLSDSSAIPTIEQINGRLIFDVDSAALTDSDGTATIHIRITMPAIAEITALKDTHISMNFFTADSLRINLGSDCDFTGTNNTIKKMKCNTTGNATIEFSSTF